MNHEGLFWVGVTKGGGYINNGEVGESSFKTKIAENLTYEACDLTN